MHARLRSVVVLSVAGIVGIAAAGSAARMPLDEKVRLATEVYLDLFEVEDREVPQALLDDASCIAIIPGVIKGAFGWGGRHGRGVLTCRNDGGWSAPIFVMISGGSFGLQIGAQSTDVVLFFVNERSVRSLLTSKFTLGGDMSLAAGPIGRRAELGTDIKLRAELYSYAKSRGLFAGVSVEGARLAPHQKSINKYYGKRLWPEQILFEGAVEEMPAEARELLSALPR
jgi:lipid-binding SYLF domain-containing protein